MTCLQASLAVKEKQIKDLKEKFKGTAVGAKIMIATVRVIELLGVDSFNTEFQEFS